MLPPLRWRPPRGPPRKMAVLWRNVTLSTWRNCGGERWIDGNETETWVEYRGSNIVEKFSNLSPRWMGQHRVVRSNETNFPLALLSYSMMRTVREGGHGRKEEWKKKEERVGSSNAAKRKIGNILRPSVRHRAGDEPRLPVCVLFWRTIIVLYRLLFKKSEFSDGKKKKRKEETFLNSVSSNEFPTDIWLY